MTQMFDSISPSEIPANAEAVAGYVNGHWPTYTELVKRWPHAHHLSIAVSSSADAECLDVEPGDATNAVAPAWVKRQMARGVKRPVLYTSVSNAAALLRALGAAGIRRDDIRLWTAHYTFHEHRCSPRCGFGMPTTADATQWTDKALGRVLDESLCAPSFFGEPRPTPNPAPPASRVFANWANWLRGGKKWRRPGHAPARISTAWWNRLAWEEWVAKGRKGRRPNVPATIPSSWWPHLKKYLAARRSK